MVSYEDSVLTMKVNICKVDEDAIMEELIEWFQNNNKGMTGLQFDIKKTKGETK